MLKKFLSWESKFLWDDIYFMVVNIYFRLRYFNRGGSRCHGLPDNIALKDLHKGKRVFVVGNGPSLLNQDITSLRNEITFFVNRAFLHKDYATIQPTYHIFVDPKLATGEWPLSFLDEVVARNPDVTFLLNGDWYELPEFQPYKKKYRIFWLSQKLYFSRFFNGAIDLTKIGVGGAVVEQGILASIYMGVREIYLLGMDFNGVPCDLVKKSSHFYGSNPENLTKSYQDIYRDLAMMSDSFRRWEMMTAYCERKKVLFVNLTEGGLLDIVPRMRYETVVGAPVVSKASLSDGRLE